MIRNGVDMPVVHVNVWEGFGEERIKVIIEGITKVSRMLGFQDML